MIQNIPLNRLKDLESENRALQDYKKIYPLVAKNLEEYESLKTQAYRIGESLEKLRNKYHDLGIEKERFIEETYRLQKSIEHSDKDIADLKNRSKDINITRNKYNNYEIELGQITGLFKGKKKNELQEHLNKTQAKMQYYFDRLKIDYKIEPNQIEQKISELEYKKSNLQKEWQRSEDDTIQLEQNREKTVKDYKYIKSLADTQSKPYKEISFRRNNKVSLSKQEELALYIARADRQEIYNRMAEQNLKILEQCRKNFAYEDMQKELQNVYQKSYSPIHSPSMER